MNDASAARFVPGGGEDWRNPFPMYAALREQDPVHHVPDNGSGEDYFVLSRFADVFAAAIDAATFSSASGLTFEYGEMERLGLESPIVMMDPPEHTSLRKLAIKQFTPRQVKGLAGMIREFAIERIEMMREMGEADIIEHLFKPLPSLVVAHFLGVPPGDRVLFDRWTQSIVSANAAGDALDAKEAIGEIVVYFSELIEQRRSAPTDDMISALVHGKLSGGGEVSLAKILGMGFTMVTGGNDTITGLLGGAAELLTRFPDQRARLLEDPRLLPLAIEEMLRLTSPVQGLARTVTRDVEIEGVAIPKGRKALLLYGSANRDEREFGPDAESLDVGRKLRRHLAFSYGAHFCVGASAARLQATIAIEELLARCPRFRVDEASAKYAGGAHTRRHERLPFFAEGQVG